MNLALNLQQWAAHTPSKPAFLFEGRTITYGQLEADVSRLAHALRARGVGPGDRVAIYLPNIPEYATTYYAAQKIGAIPVAINSIFRSGEVEYLLQDSGAVVVFTVAELVPFVPRDACPAVAHVVVCEGEAASGTETLEQWCAGQPATFDPVERAPDDPAALLYSSGTTGFPKGVTLTQSNVSTNAASAAKYSGYREDDRLCVFLPLFHVYGQNYILNAAIHAGSTICLFRRFVPETVLESIERDRITLFFGVPTIFIGLLAMDLSKYDLSSIRYEMSAAATMPEEISRRWTDRFGRRVYEGYGLTECSPFACYNDLEEHRFGSVGRAIEGFELIILDENDQEVPHGEWGEICIKGPGVMSGYWNRPEDTAQALRGGWLHSGDIGRMDDDGYVYIVDRVKDMINVSGFKVWPAELEQYLYKLPQIREVAVYGIPHPEKGEQVVAAVVPKSGETIEPADVIAWCRANVAAYKVPARVDIVSELPKSATGKILKRVLRDEAAKP